MAPGQDTSAKSIAIVFSADLLYHYNKGSPVYTDAWMNGCGMLRRTIALAASESTVAEGSFRPQKSPGVPKKMISFWQAL